MKSETTMELDFAAGYLIGQFEATYEYGELSEKQYDELTQIVNYIHEGERQKKENEELQSVLLALSLRRAQMSHQMLLVCALRPATVSY